MKTVGVKRPHVANGELASDVPVVHGPQGRLDESVLSIEADGSIKNLVSTLESSESNASSPTSTESIKDEAEIPDDRDVAAETVSTGAETTGAETATDESIISTADLRDVFNRLEVIVQKLARGGAVW